ncbi:MAG: hypothetical protein IPL71_22935 [Anaerolineales bacterium]|uniref:hypothetical protein n=1 Tax=Candidatus Villigracilis proximus TaxID=3140683 RepID=UPI003135A9EC|nr:hypothetical protein [Anaerolineales bacterium]
MNNYKETSKFCLSVSRAGAWKYSHIYEVVPRHFPDLPEQARKITESQARLKLLELYFNLVGAAQMRDVTKLFGWPGEVANRALNKLIDQDLLAKAVHTKQAGEWVCHSKTAVLRHLKKGLANFHETFFVIRISGLLP